MGEEYNGWTNRETWLVNVWFSPQSQADLDYLQEALEAVEDELKASDDDGRKCIADMCYLSEVNWAELSGHVKDFETETEEAES